MAHIISSHCKPLTCTQFPVKPAIAEGKMELVESSSAASHGLEIIEAKPLTILAAVRRRKRRKINPLELKDAAEMYGLPEGWRVEQRARTNAKYHGKVDKYFYEPVTRKQFRSLKSVLLYLRWKMHRNQQKSEPPSQFCHFRYWSQGSSSEQRQEKKRASGLNLDEYPPEKITWVLMDDERQDWKPFIEETKVPEKVKHCWAETFMFINGV